MALSEREKGAHLLRRFGLGASESELNYYMQGGLKGAINMLLNCETIPEPKENTVRKVRNNRTDEVKWLLPSGGLSPIKPKGMH